MGRLQRLVRLFHVKFGFTRNSRPTLINRKLGILRYRLLVKEAKELYAGVKEDDLVKIADALGDLLYFILGTGVAYGINLGPVVEEIHRSNMTKSRPVPGKDIDAKALKGEGYSPPNLMEVLTAQMGGAS